MRKTSVLLEMNYSKKRPFLRSSGDEATPPSSVSSSNLVETTGLVR